MPRAEPGTPKYLANKMKAKGLQKLRWYCQMCQKQCRDENGFKCHTMSESHQRQILLFADNSKKYLDEFSYEFAKCYLDILRRQFGTKRVAANRVYQEYIADRNHVHMNATRWVTLTGFVKWCGRTGKCVVDETEKGWFIQYIDRDPDTIAREERKNKKIKMDKDDEEKTLEFIEKQVKFAQEKEGDSVNEPAYTELVRENEQEPLKLDIKLQEAKPKQIVKSMVPLSKLLKSRIKEEPKCEEETEEEHGDKRRKYSKQDTKIDTFKKPSSSKRSALDEIMEKEEQNKEKSNRKDFWITEGIIVKVVTKSLGDSYYKQKALIVDVKDRYTAIVKLLETGKKLKLDQSHLETVIPAVGGEIRVVNGAYRGEKAILLGIDEDHFCAEIEISCGLLKGRNVKAVEYEDICKLGVDL